MFITTWFAALDGSSFVDKPGVTLAEHASNEAASFLHLVVAADLDISVKVCFINKMVITYTL